MKVQSGDIREALTHLLVKVLDGLSWLGYHPGQPCSGYSNQTHLSWK